jgi:hypothetical protein
MSLLQTRPIDRPVLTDVTGRPIRVVIAEHRVSVDTIEAVREEVAAYPAATGPRTLFRVLAGGTRLRLVHEHRADRWTVDTVRAEPAPLASAA